MFSQCVHSGWWWQRKHFLLSCSTLSWQPFPPDSLQWSFPSDLALPLYDSKSFSCISGRYSAEECLLLPQRQETYTILGPRCSCSFSMSRYFSFPPRQLQSVFIGVLGAPDLLLVLHWLIAFITQGISVQLEPCAFLTGVLLSFSNSTPQKKALSDLLPCP